MAATSDAIPENTIRVLDHGFVRLDGSMASDLSVVNGARVSFARRKDEMDESDAGLIRFLMRDRHGCYDDATEVLTTDGWKAWPDVTGDETFATRSREGVLEYQPALRLVRKEHRGHMIGFKGTSVDLCVTPDHRVLAAGMTTRAGRATPRFRLQPAHAVLWRSHRHVATARWSGPEPERLTYDGLRFSAAWLFRLVGFFIGDGSLASPTAIGFNLRKDREIAFLRRVAGELGLELRMWGGRHAISLGPELRELFERCYDPNREKVVPDGLLSYGPGLLGALYEGLLESDGSGQQRPERADREVYSTTSKRLADQVQELALKLGRSASVRPHPAAPGDGHVGSEARWLLTVYSARNSRPALCRTREQADNHMGVEPYDGAIHCVEVPNSTLYVRRNGYPVWCGNTPFEHNAFRFHVRCPIFVAREWMRHRVGCLTGDTVVTFVDANGHTGPRHRKTLDELWEMWTGGERNGHALTAEEPRAVDRLAGSAVSRRGIARELGIGRRAAARHPGGGNAYRDARWRVRRLRLRVLNEATNEFEIGHISEIVDKGIQPVYRLTLADGRALTLTENHRLLTGDGWMTMREAVGLSGRGPGAGMTLERTLVTNGTPAYKDRDWWGGVTPRRASTARWPREQAPRVHRRFDQVSAAAPLEDVPSRTGWKLTGHPVAVASVEYVGTRQTYDLCLEGPWHNFVANGVVVHNSFNEFSMRYAKATDEFYVPEPDDVRTQVGKPGAYSFEPVEPEVAEQTREELRAVYDAAYAAYERLVELGVARELARCVMPVGAYTEFYWTINARSLMNFVSLRAAETAQREIRRYADAVEQFFAELMPVTHAAFVANGRVAP